MGEKARAGPYIQPRGGNPGSHKSYTREGVCEAGFSRDILDMSSLSESPRIPLPHPWMSMCTTGGFCAPEADSPPVVRQLPSVHTHGNSPAPQLTAETWASLQHSPAWTSWHSR